MKAAAPNSLFELTQMPGGRGYTIYPWVMGNCIPRAFSMDRRCSPVTNAAERFNLHHHHCTDMPLIPLDLILSTRELTRKAREDSVSPLPIEPRCLIIVEFSGIILCMSFPPPPLVLKYRQRSPCGHPAITDTRY